MTFSCANIRIKKAELSEKPGYVKPELEYFYMNYEQFITELQKYWDLRSKGLKKQANTFLFAFTGKFKAEVPELEAEDILFRFCKEYIDEMKFPGKNLPRRHLPYQVTDLLNSYLIRECERNKMPQLRWAFQLFGTYYNPHDPACEHNHYHNLERAYAHEQCDQQTISLYFEAQVNHLWWGQHHFPEGCIITKADFEATVHTAYNILSEKPVDPSLTAAFEYYVKLYHIYFHWIENGRNGDFYELCQKEGLEYKGAAAL